MKDNDKKIDLVSADEAAETVDQPVTEENTDAADIVESPEDEPGVLVLEGEHPEEDEEVKEDAGVRPTYMPRFTEVSEKYRRKGDAKIRERLGIKAGEDREVKGNPDELKLDPTAEFESDISGSTDARAPENSAIEESDESISVDKRLTPEEELEAEAEKERAAIRELLKDTPAPAEQPEVEEETEPEIEDAVEEKEEEYELPDPDADEIKVYEFVDTTLDQEPADNSTEADNSKKKIKKKDREFSNPIQRDGIKDSFLDTILSIKIRRVASVIFALVMLVLEILSATRVIGFNVFEKSQNYATLGIVDFLLAACVFIMAGPELIDAVRDLFNKKLTAALVPIPVFIVLGIYTLILANSGETSYMLLGLLFATLVIPVLTSSLDRTKADFIAFKMIAQPEEKEVIDLQNTKDCLVENKALDGAVDEYKSRLSRTFTASFISDFFKNSEAPALSPKHFGLVYGIPFGVALVSGVVAYFLLNSFVGAMAVFALVVMLGCPAFSIVADKVSFFHSQRAALYTDSIAIGEQAYTSYSKVDVFAFDDTDIFGPEDVNLKRFMLYGDRDNMDKVMRQMCALFAAVGGPLDCMFSGIIDNRQRHKTASNLIIEDDGVCGEVAGHRICAGSEDYMRRNGIALPPADIGGSTGAIDTTKVMYAAEDGEVNAKFYIRYSFSEEFTSIIPSLRDAGIIPLIYTRDPNVSTDLLAALTAGNGNMRVVKLYDAVSETTVKPRENARMVTYGDRLDAAGMILLSKKYSKFRGYIKFAEICAVAFGIALAIALSFITHINFKAIPLVSLWHILMCAVIRLVSKAVFLKDSNKKSID